MTTTAADSAPASGAVPPGAAPEPTDENIWLEDIYGEQQLAWVREQNARTEDLLEDANAAIEEFLQGRGLCAPRRGDP